MSKNIDPTWKNATSSNADDILSNVHGIFNKIDHCLGHKASINKFYMMLIIEGALLITTELNWSSTFPLFSISFIFGSFYFPLQFPSFSFLWVSYSLFKLLKV